MNARRNRTLRTPAGQWSTMEPKTRMQRPAKPMRWCLALHVGLLLVVGGAHAQATEEGATAPPPLVPESFSLSDAVQNSIEAPYLTPEERSSMRLRHGVYTEDDLTTPARVARVALLTWRLDDPVFVNEDVPVELRAEAMLRRGDLTEALGLLEGAQSIRADRIRAMSFEGLGRYDEALEAVEPVVNRLLARRMEEADALVEGVRALILRSTLLGQPARDYQTMLDLLAQARSEMDPFHWQTHLTEAGLLLDKDNPGEAVAALHEALALNPRLSRAWYMLGLVALDRFDFDAASRASSVLRGLNPAHALADLLDARAALMQNDPTWAKQALSSTLDRYPRLREARALECAAIALEYDRQKLDDALASFEELSPGSAEAYYLAGQTLSFARQYEWAAELLNEAIRRQPRWPAPRIELALLEMQSGRDALALEAMRELESLDRFNKRVANSLFLLETLADYKRIETEHFIIRFSPETQDQVLVDMMPEILERIHETVATRFQHEPDRKTIIELMPNHQQFAVRITGMPHIHTIAAATGPVIAMEVPREGSPGKHFGVYDWPRVVQHEYTHTITLSQTSNRIPHWLTEAAAVSMEQKPRSIDTIRQLVAAYRGEELFTLDEINWAFVRPKRPGDRALAYAQGHWMLEYMNHRFGESALLQLLARYDAGEREGEAVPNALGISRDDFFDSFLVWAETQVEKWGFGAQPSLESLKDILRENDPDIRAQMKRNQQLLAEAVVAELTRRVGEPTGQKAPSLDATAWPALPKPDVEISHEQLATWLEDHPEHPDLLELATQRAIAMVEQPGLDLVPLLEKYAEARPVDPMPHRYLALIWRESETPERAIPHLEYLDEREQYSNVYALGLARLYNQTGDYEQAMEKVTRAVNINAYDATVRELAATIALKAGKLRTARKHIVALTTLEPERPQHQKRLEAIDRMLAAQE